MARHTPHTQPPPHQTPDQPQPRANTGRRHAQPPRHRPTTPPTPSRDREAGGTSTLYAVILTVAIFAIVGLVVDGGAMLTAHQQADSIARQAARTAGQEIQVDPTSRRPAAAAKGLAAGRAYAHDHGCETSTVTISGPTITATCSIRYNPLFLPGTYLATRTANATAETVVTP